MTLCGGFWGNGCPPGESTQTFTTACASRPNSETFARVPRLTERLARARLRCEFDEGWERVKCLGRSAWTATFATDRAHRVNRAMAELRDAAAE